MKLPSWLTIRRTQRRRLPPRSDSPDSQRFVSRRQVEGGDVTKRRKRQSSRRTLLLHGTGIFFLVCAVGLMYFVRSTQLQELTIKRLDTRISEQLVGNQLRDYLGRSLFLIRSKQVEQDLQRAFPELETIHVSKQYPGQMIIEVGSSDPVAYWSCFPDRGANAVITAALAHTGRILEVYEKPVNEGALQINEYGDCPSQLQIRDAILLPSVLTSLRTFLNQLQTITLTDITTVEYEREAREITYIVGDIRIHTDLAVDLQQQSDTLIAAIISKSGLLEVAQDIDLRIPGKLYYTPR